MATVAQAFFLWKQPFLTGSQPQSWTGTFTWRSTIGPGTVVYWVSYRPHSRTTSETVVTGLQTV